MVRIKSEVLGGEEILVLGINEMAGYRDNNVVVYTYGEWMMIDRFRIGGDELRLLHLIKKQFNGEIMGTTLLDRERAVIAGGNG